MEYTKSFLNKSVYRCVTVVLCTVLTVCLLSFSLDVNRYKHGLYNTEYHEQYCHIRRLNSSVDDILCMKQIQYLPEFKNPCWKNGTEFHCLPYFMLIGMDKCGSTDLFNRLIKHPEILGNGKKSTNPNDNKETKWWSWLRYGYWLVGNGRRENFKDYIAYFEKSAAQINEITDTHGYHPLITGDGTPMDMWDFRGWTQIPQNWNKTEPVVLTPHLIKHLRPEMKFIIILRNPIERLYSDYFFIGLGEPSSQAFDHAVISSLHILDNCTRNNSLRKCLYDKDLHVKWDYQARLHLGFYSVYLKEWLNVFPRRQFLIIRTEDYSKNTFEHMSKIFDFLDVGAVDENLMNIYGIMSKDHKYKTTSKQKAAPMSNRIKDLLSKLYQPYNIELADILGDRRYLWDDGF